MGELELPNVTGAEVLPPNDSVEGIAAPKGADEGFDTGADDGPNEKAGVPKEGAEAEEVPNGDDARLAVKDVGVAELPNENPAESLPPK